MRLDQDKQSNPGDVSLVHASGPDKNQKVDSDESDDGRKHRYAFEEFLGREDGVEVDGVRWNCKTASEGRQMSTQALRLHRRRLLTHLYQRHATMGMVE